MEALVFSLFIIRTSRKETSNTILNIFNIFNIAVNYAIYLTSASFAEVLFFTRYTVNVNNVRRVHRKASESFIRKIFRCIFTDRDFPTIYRARFCTILL